MTAQIWEGIKVGDRVKCKEPGSWVDGREGVVLRLNVTSSDNIEGHLLQMAEGVTVVPPCCLTVVSENGGVE